MNNLDRCKWVLPVLCLLIAGRLAAAEYWVSPSGNDTSAGTHEAPWQTLRKAAVVAVRNLAYTPRPPITEGTMITEGLVVWLDAADRATLKVTADGTVTVWRDKSAARRVALPTSPNGSVKWVADGMNGKPTVRGNGTGKLRFKDLKGVPKPITVFVVAQSLQPRGPDWQRVIASFTGVGQEWVLPNWIINAPGGKTPSTWPPRLFLFQQREGAALGRITVLGASASQGQALGSDISEVLIFDRSLRFDETEAVTKYLNEKWGLK